MRIRLRFKNGTHRSDRRVRIRVEVLYITVFPIALGIDRRYLPGGSPVRPTFS